MNTKKRKVRKLEDAVFMQQYITWGQTLIEKVNKRRKKMKEAREQRQRERRKRKQSERHRKVSNT